MSESSDHAPADDPPVEPAERARSAFAIVGVGASAGGFEALGALLRRFTLDTMAFVVVSHMAADADSHFAHALAQYTRSPVVAATDGTAVEPNRVYVIPPGVDLALLHGVLHLMKPASERPHLPIDFFFRSLAEDQRTYAIGIVLSGTGSDGTQGLRAIKAEGGITFAQLPSTARFDGMPSAALEAGCADFCLTPEGIADELATFGHHAYLRRPRRPPEARPERLGKIFVLLRDAFGQDLSLYKHGTIERRIERRMAVHRLEGIEEYVAFLQSRPTELAVLYKDILIGVTSFFRDREPFELLKTTGFPRLTDRRPTDVPIRIWVPGCSTGEEPYSVAMALLEFLGERAANYKIQIFATDLDDAAVQTARRALYPPQIALDVSPERLQRFFTAKQGGFQVRRRIRDMVVFATQNVTKDPPFSRLDLITCRNLLIYLQPALQRKVLRIFHYALTPDGHLMLGTSETVGDSPDLFSVVSRTNKIYRKKNIPSSAPFDVTFGESVPRNLEPILRPSPDVRPMANIQQIADRKVLERYGPPGVVINENFEVLQFRGKTGPYLEPLPGAASLHLLKLARPELATDLRAAVHRALDTNAVVVVRGVALKQADVPRTVDIEVVPITEPETRGRCLLVLFRDVVVAAAADAPGSATVHATPSEPDPRLPQLEAELTALKEYLQSTIEELETSNEELKSANEELQSSNEELQSTNEELETSKEELQSTNEELTTVNDELHSRMVDLGQSNDDLYNLLSGVETPIVIVGLDLRIRRFTHAAEKLLNLIAADMGRPVGYLSWFLPGERLERMIADVIEHLATRHEDISAANGRRYRINVAAYKTVDHSIKGAVVTFVDIGATDASPPAPTTSS